MTSNNNPDAELGRVLDALNAIRLDLSCYGNHPPHVLVLSAAKVRDTCRALDDAVFGLKRILSAGA